MGDNFCLATEMVAGFWMASTAPRVYIKVDLVKAYDSMSWDALENILRDLNFQDNAIQLIMDCVRYTSFSVLVEGKSIKVFREGRGSRQGNPIFPYLFAQVMESLFVAIEDRVVRGDVKLFKVHGMIGVSHLAYVDNLLLLCKATTQSLKGFEDILNDFSMNTGMLVSQSQSEVFFSNGTQNAKWLAEAISFSIGVFPTTYLGLSLCPRTMEVSECSRLVDLIDYVIY